MTVKSLLVKIGTDISAMEAGFQKADGLIAKNAEKFRKAGKIMTGAGAAIVGSLGMMVKNFADAGDEVHKMALRTGFSTETLSELKYAADISGASLATLEKGVKKMQMSIGEGAEGVKTYTDAFAKIGLNVQELIGLSPEEQFMKIAGAIASVEDPTLRAASAQEILGRAGTELLPLFAEGATGMEALRQRARELGLSMDQDAANKAAAFKDSLTALKGSLSGVAVGIGAQLAPMITGLAENISNIIGKVRAWMEKHPELAGLILKVVGAVGVLSAVLGPILIILPALASGFTILLGPVGLVAAAVAGLAALAVLIVTKWEPITEFLSNVWETIKNVFTTALGAIRDFFVTFITGYIGIYVTAFEKIKTIITTAWEAIKGFFTDAYTAISEAVSAFFETFVGFFTGFFETLKEGISIALEAVVGFFTGAYTAISDALSTFITNFATFFSDFFEGVKELVSTAWETVTGFFMGAFEKVTTALTTFITDFIAFFTNFITDLLELVTGLVTRIIEKFTGMFKKVKEIVGKLKDATIGIFKGLKEKIVGHSLIPDMCTDIIDTLQKMKQDGVAEFDALAEGGKTAIGDLDAASETGFGNIEDYVGAMASEVGSAFTSVAGSLKSSAGAIVKTLQGKAIAYIITKVMAALPFPFNLAAVAGAIAAVKALFSTIKLGEGGIVTSRTIAEIGERGPEAVIPLNRLRGGLLQPAPVYVKMSVYNYGDISNVGDLDEISDRLAIRVTRQIERGRRS